jgi:1,4-alpha-glucan branching enzyme
VADLNKFYRNEPSLYQLDFEPAGFEWIDCGDIPKSIFSLIRKGRSQDDPIIAICNFTPQTHFNYDIGVPLLGTWQEVLNGDAAKYGGSGQGNPNALESKNKAMHGRPYSITLTIPPLAVIFLKRTEPEK